MKRTLISPDIRQLPQLFQPYAGQSRIYDSSSSKTASVWYLDRGFFLKSAPAGALKTEQEMTAYFFQKGLGPEPILFLSQERDWLLTKALPGRDCTHFTEDPLRLCDTLAAVLRSLHETDFSGCPVTDRCGAYRTAAAKAHAAGFCDLSLFPDTWRFSSREEAWQTAAATAHLLKNDTLIHGDYCLPNVLLDNWRFSGFLDLDRSGLGDRHIDIFWATWTLNYNLKTNRFFHRFLDAYGRDAMEPELLRTVAAPEVFL